MDFIVNGGAGINNLIKRKIGEGCREIVVSGNYEIEETIILPSGITFILNDCCLRMADGTFCQMFRNASAEKDNVYDSDIHIKGIGTAISLGRRNI